MTFEQTWDSVYAVFEDNAFDYRGFDFSSTPVSGFGKFHYLVDDEGSVTGVIINKQEFWKAPF